MHTTTAVSVSFLAAALVVVFLYIRVRSFKRQIKRHEEEMRHRMYELSILKEVGDRVGYSLNIKKIADVIIGSLPQFMEYGAASYMLFDSDKVLFRTDLRASVSKDFVGSIKEKMRQALGALVEREISESRIDETITGEVTVEDGPKDAGSFFNIPLVVGGKVLGIITVANTNDKQYEEGEMTLLYKIVANATGALERLERVIKTEQGKLGAMVESMSDGVVMTDKDYRIIVANPAVKKIAGIGRTGDLTMFDLIDAFSGVVDVRGKLEESLKMKKTFAVDNVILNNQVFQVFVSPVLGGEKEEVLGGLVIFHDVTNIKKAERMREEFTSMIVHELRSPLDGIKKMGELMRTDETIRKDEKTYNEYMEMIYESASAMLELVNDILDVAKIESGKFDVRKQPADIKKVVAERVKFYKPIAKDAGITLRAVFGEGVPERVDIDAMRIAQVLNNFISNALKFTPRGGGVDVCVLFHKKGEALSDAAAALGVRWFVSRKYTSFGDAVVVAVTDTGPGIAKTDIPKLFNKFVQFEAAARSKKRGTGLGLVVAKGIIDAHGGKIGVGSEEGRGSTFYFLLGV